MHNTYFGKGVYARKKQAKQSAAFAALVALQPALYGDSSDEEEDVFDDA